MIVLALLNLPLHRHTHTHSFCPCTVNYFLHCWSSALHGKHIVSGWRVAGYKWSWRWRCDCEEIVMKISSVYALRLQLLLSVEKLLRVSPVREREGHQSGPVRPLNTHTHTLNTRLSPSCLCSLPNLDRDTAGRWSRPFNLTYCHQLLSVCGYFSFWITKCWNALNHSIKAIACDCACV